MNYEKSGATNSPIKSMIIKRRKYLIVIAAFCVLGTVFLRISNAANTPIKGDLDNNGIVNMSDVSSLLADFGKSSTTKDLDGDGKVTISDLSILLTNYGKTAPAPTPTPTTPPPTTPPTTPPPTTPPTTPPTPTPAGDGETAAAKFNWGTPAISEEMNDIKNFDVYNNPNKSDFGLRIAANVSTANGILTILGKPDGTTGGIALKHGQKQGKWEFRAKWTTDHGCHRPVGLLWPDAENWPEGGEVDYAESGDGFTTEMNFHLHYGSSNSTTDESTKIDGTQWNNYSVDWSSSGIKGYVNGVQYFSDTNASHMPPGSMHQTFQLDSPDQDKPCSGSSTTWQIDWLRIYNP